MRWELGVEIKEAMNDIVVIPKALGLVMKSLFMSCVLTPMKISEPYWELSDDKICSSCGLNNAAALCNSAEHSPFLLLIASSAGTHPSGPVPVTSTLLAPRSYSLCNIFKKSNVYHVSIIRAFGLGYKFIQNVSY